MKQLNETFNNGAKLLNNILNNDLVKYIQPSLENIIFNVYAVHDNLEWNDNFLNEYLRIYSIYNDILLQNSDIFKDTIDNPEIVDAKTFDDIINNKFIPYLNSKIKEFHISNDELALCYKKVNNQVKILYNIIKQYSTGNFTPYINQTYIGNLDTLLYPFQALNTVSQQQLNNISIYEYTYNDFINKNKITPFKAEQQDLIITFDKNNNILQSGLQNGGNTCIAEYNQKYVQFYIETIQNKFNSILNNYNSYITYKKINNIKFPIISASIVTDFYNNINIKPPKYMLTCSTCQDIYVNIANFYVFDKIFVIKDIYSLAHRFQNQKHKIIYSPIIDNIYKGDNNTLISNRYNIPSTILNMYKELINLFQQKADSDTSTQFIIKTQSINNFIQNSLLQTTRIQIDNSNEFNFNSHLNLNILLLRLYKIYHFIQKEYQAILKLYNHQQAYNYLKTVTYRIDALNKILKLT